ncbi:hypothetical protein GOP47_0003792 [Adiantum capillus-veneris]|uniref:Uncharacterized protein n=1 Tax=Adiantum capillus-veneris TaxID=13818 RepID=A0A9D4V6D0_ADICA|nr:hypothetical protein GOP47_0003792 [Adiantum capillus-veneris]
MSAAAGAAFTRPLYGAEHVKALLQSAVSCTSSSYNTASSCGKKGAWLHPRQQFAAARKKSVLGQQDWTVSFAEFCRYSQPNSEQHNCLPLMPRSRVREGGADSESKGSNPSFDSGNSVLKKEPSLLLSLVQEIQPLDASQISKEVSADSTDAMKRTISGMLGLLPSDQFHVTVETSREPLGKLFVSSMMTGYTLRNAEYRLCLQKSLEFSGDDEVGGGDRGLADFQAGQEDVKGMLEAILRDREGDSFAEKTLEDLLGDHPGLEAVKDTSQFLDSLGDDARLYIQHLQQKLAAVTKELEECKQINTGLQVQSLVGEEKNDLLDYLRSLSPDKVAELSQPTSPEVEEVIQEVINGLLDSPATKLQQKGTQLDNGTVSSLSSPWEDESIKKLSSSPLQSQSAVIVSRDHLARLLFWCMLLGHHMRGLEYRLELSRTLSLCGDLEPDVTER